MRRERKQWQVRFRLLPDGTLQYMSDPPEWATVTLTRPIKATLADWCVAQANRLAVAVARREESDVWDYRTAIAYPDDPCPGEAVWEFGAKWWTRPEQKASDYIPARRESASDAA